MKSFRIYRDNVIAVGIGLTVIIWLLGPEGASDWRTSV
jgi:hypothetical protein